MISLGPHRYFAIVDDRHDVKDPVTVVRVFDGAGPAGVTELNPDAYWVRSRLLDRIEAGEVPYRARLITEKAAARIREQRERKISFRYFLLVRDDDPDDRPVGVLREWDATGRDRTYAETYSGPDHRWLPSTVRQNIERGSDIATRIVAADASAVHRFISSLNGW
jgi:hypothetical protein